MTVLTDFLATHQLLTILITMPINFLANKLWTFRHVRNQHAESQAGIR